MVTNCCLCDEKDWKLNHVPIIERIKEVKIWEAWDAGPQIWRPSWERRLFYFCALDWRIRPRSEATGGNCSLHVRNNKWGCIICAHNARLSFRAEDSVSHDLTLLLIFTTTKNVNRSLIFSMCPNRSRELWLFLHWASLHIRPLLRLFLRVDFINLSNKNLEIFQENGDQLGASLCSPYPSPKLPSFGKNNL